MTDRRTQVFEGLDHSLENGYFKPGEMFFDASASDIASDIVAYDADLENADPKDLVPFIQEWLTERGLAV